MIDEKRLLELTEENNRILKAMLRRARWASFFAFLKLAVYVGLLYWAYLTLQPYLEQVQRLYSQTQRLEQQAGGATNVQDLINQAQKYLQGQQQKTK